MVLLFITFKIDL